MIRDAQKMTIHELATDLWPDFTAYEKLEYYYICVLERLVLGIDRFVAWMKKP